MVLFSTVAPVHKEEVQKSKGGKALGDLVADFRRIANLAQVLNESSRWTSEVPAVATGKIILKRETFRLEEKTSKPMRAPERTDFLSIPSSKEVDIRALLALNTKESETLGLKRVASTRTCEGRAEQFHETFFEMPSAVFKYSLVESKKR